MRANLRFCLLFIQVAIVVLDNETYFGGLIKFDCFKQREMTGCNTSGQTTDLSDVAMYLFTEKSKVKPEFLHLCGGKLPNNTSYNPEKKTKVVIAGYLGFVCTTAYPTELKDQLICRDGSNVLVYDWMYKLGSKLDYYVAVQQVEPLGEKLAFVLQNMIDLNGAKPSDIHIIGHSFGAHIGGVAGDRLKKNGHLIDRITGLDPAAPGFQNQPFSKILDKGDADWVDMIHTTLHKCLPYLGDPRALGHADFYVDGKNVRKGCLHYALIAFQKRDFSTGLLRLLPSGCDHLHAVEIFKATINLCECQFNAIECNITLGQKLETCGSCGPDGSKCAVMGMDWEKYPRSKESKTYCIETGVFCPYCKNNACLDTAGFPKNRSDGSSPRCCPSS